jgi:hypothetical protein
MAPGPADDESAMLNAARDNCRRLVGKVRRDAQALQGRSRVVSEETLGEGRAAYDRALAAAEQLLRRLDDDPLKPT